MMTSRPVKIVIVDRNDVTRKGIQAIITDASQPYEVIAAFTRLCDVDNFVQDQRVDIVIVDDTTLHPIEIVRLVTRYHETQPGLGVIVLSQRRDGEYIQKVMQHGSAGYILKNSDLQNQILTAVKMIGEKYPFISTEAAKLMFSQGNDELTPRDLEVLRLLEQEQSIKQIGKQLAVTDKTVYRLRDKLKRVLGVRNNESIVDAARQRGLLEHKEE